MVNTQSKTLRVGLYQTETATPALVTLGKVFQYKMIVLEIKQFVPEIKRLIPEIKRLILNRFIF